MVSFDSVVSYEPVASLNHSSSQAINQFDTDSTRLKSSHQRRGDRRWSRVVVQLWLYEWLAWSAALASIVATVIVLVIFNGKPIPDWPYGITLGALVSVLATLATVGLMEPIAAGIGQARWIWFSKERSMADFELIDSASRGPFGSAWLVVRGKGGLLAITGAVLLITTQAIGPFVQQVVQSNSQVVNQSAVAVPIAETYNTFATQDGGVLSRDISLSMKAAIQRGILDIDANTSTFFVSPQCPTGNCTWEPYTTLAVCGRCADLSDKLSVSPRSEAGTTTTSLPNNITLESVPGTTEQGFIAMTVNTTSGDVDKIISSIAYPEWQSPVLDVFTIIAAYGNGSGHETQFGPYASECILQFCVRNFISSSINGSYSEHPVSGQEPIYLNGTYSFAATKAGTRYTLDYDTFVGLNTYLEDMFNTVIRQQNGVSPVSQWTDDVSQSIFYWMNRTADHSPVPLFENVAASMSLNTRLVSNLSMKGTATSLQSIVAVKWQWMTLPFAILVLVGVFLAAISWSSRAKSLEPWKTSSLAVLMHGFTEEESRSLVTGVQRLNEMEDVAERLKLKAVEDVMTRDEDGLRVGRAHTHLVAR